MNTQPRKTHTYEVVKEYVFMPENLDIVVRGRIVRNVENSERPFMWQISHRWKPNQRAGFYYPSATSAATMEEVEQLLFAYAHSFTELVKEDPHY